MAELDYSGLKQIIMDEVDFPGVTDTGDNVTVTIIGVAPMGTSSDKPKWQIKRIVSNETTKITEITIAEDGSPAYVLDDFVTYNYR
jgi:hypothetical protein